MIETLFVSNVTNAIIHKDINKVQVLQNQESRVLDPKKSQNIAILLRALNVTNEEVCEALLEGEMFLIDVNFGNSFAVLQRNVNSSDQVGSLAVVVHQQDCSFCLHL